MSLKEKNETLSEDYDSIDDVSPIVSSDPLEYTPAPIPEEEISVPEPEPEPKPVGEDAGTKDTTLIDEIEDLIADQVFMKKGSRGTRVGTVQKFLKRYGISITADNDYGDSTVTAVKKFQSEQKITADGETGPGTYKKMIEWLQKN